MAKSQVLICPYCGATQPAGDRCQSCAGLFEPLSRQATHNAMGPWSVRNEQRPYQPGCSYETLVVMVERGQVTKYTILRGPTTKQFWTVAKHVPGVAHLLGFCHNCDATVDPVDHGCHECGVPFGAYLDRNYLGLPDIAPLPWEASVDSGNSTSQPRVGPRPSYAPAASGLSSFATDEELLRPAPATLHDDDSVGVLIDRGTTMSVTAGSSGPSAMVPADPAPEVGASGSAARAMQRRLAHQERTIKRLFAVLIVTIVGAAITLLILSGRMMGANDPDTPRESDHTSSTGITESESVEGESPSLPDDTTSNTEPSAPPDEPSEVSVPSVQAEYDRAQALAIAADDTNRETSARLTDYVTSLAILRQLQRNALPAELPDTLESDIERIEAQRKRLELDDEFYAPPDGTPSDHGSSGNSNTTLLPGNS